MKILDYKSLLLKFGAWRCFRTIAFRYWKDAIEHKHFRLANPVDFVDLNDCVGRCKGLLSPSAIRSWFDNDGENAVITSRIVLDAFSKHSREVIQKALCDRAFISRQAWVLSVSDATTQNDASEVMFWKKYGLTDGVECSGVRFRFSFPKVETVLVRSRKIRYSDQLPEFDLSTVQGSFLNDERFIHFFDGCVWTKKTSFSWENELRIVVDDRASPVNGPFIDYVRESNRDRLHPYLKIEPFMLDQVVFGAALPIKEYRHDVEMLKCCADYSHVHFFRQANDGGLIEI